jgi:tetratricopeptide (TPR) repeat protein
MASDPSSRDAEAALSLVHEGWRHMQLQRPMAAWASWQQAIRLKPGDRAATEALERLAIAEELPEVARKPRRLSNPSDDEARSRWNDAFQGRDLSDLDAAASAFEDLAEDEPSDAAAWSNRALCLAWLGRNDEAIDAIDYYVHLAARAEPDLAAEAWALAEILRQGAGAEHRADDLSYSFELPWPADAPPPFEADEAAGAVREMPVPLDPVTLQPMAAGSRIVEWLDRPMPPASPEPGVPALPHVRAVVLLAPGLLRCSGLDRSAIEEVEHAIEGRLGRGLEFDRRSTPLPLAMLDAAAATVRLPEGLSADSLRRLQAEAIADEFERRWVAVPRLGLGAGLGIGRTIEDEDAPARRSPLEAAALIAEGDEVMRAKLSGVILVREQLARRPRSADLYLGYDFDRLRRRLGLDALDAPPPGVDLPLQPRRDTK